MFIRQPKNLVCLLVLGLCLSAVCVSIVKARFIGIAEASASFGRHWSTAWYRYRAFARIHVTHPRGLQNLDLHTHRGTYFVWAECPQGEFSTSDQNKPKTGGIFLSAQPTSNTSLNAQSLKYGDQNSGIAIAWIEIEDHFGRTRSDYELEAPD